MRRLGSLLAVLALLGLPAAATAGTETAAGGGVSATLTWRGGLGITIKHVRLRLVRDGRVFSAPVRSHFCYLSCSPGGERGSLHVTDLTGTGTPDVVLDLWSGGADCCVIEQVFYPTLSGGWARAERNFGNYGARLERLAYGGTAFVSGDSNFYCTFNACAGSGLPLQIESFRGGGFHDITARFPARIARDATQWLRLFDHHPHDGTGLIAAWAADEDRLGHVSLVARTLAADVRAHDFGRGFVRQLNAFLRRHGYLS